MQSTKDLQKIAEAFGGMPIWGCTPGSPCHRAGVVYGDIILSVNGHATGSIEAYQEAKRLDDELFRVRILRRGREIEVCVPVHAGDRVSGETYPVLDEMTARATSSYIDEDIN